MIRSLTSVTT